MQLNTRRKYHLGNSVYLCHLLQSITRVTAVSDKFYESTSVNFLKIIND